jgi:elongation factor G
MDRVGADFFDVVSQIKNRLSANPLPLQMPMGSEDLFTGFIDLVSMKAVVFNTKDQGSLVEAQQDIPEEYQEAAQRHRDLLLEVIAEVDDQLTEKYLNGENLTATEIERAIRKGCIGQKFVPVLCGASFKNKGVQALLDAIVKYLPSPMDLPPVDGKDPSNLDSVLHRKPSNDEPFSALAFKVMNDPFVGQLIYFRVYSGVAKTGQMVFNPGKDKKERLGRLIRMHANKREDIDEVHAGEIAAAVGMRFTVTGDTLCEEHHPIVLERMEFPEPVISIAIEPKTKADQEKLSGALAKLAAEDPSFRISNNEETGQILISGMGELHLEIIVDRMKREFKVDGNIGQPQVAYKETVLKSALGEGKFIRQVGGKNQYGHCVVQLEPMARGTGFAFESRVTQDKLPKQFVAAVSKGLEESMLGGIQVGYPAVDIKAILVDGSFSETDSTEVAYKIAASIAYKDAAAKASPAILEPIMSCEITCPEDYMGGVMGDLNGRRGRIHNMSVRHGVQVIQAEVPLATMFGYSTALRSSSQGRATFSMEFSHYEPTPPGVAQEILTRAGVIF